MTARPVSIFAIALGLLTSSCSGRETRPPAPLPITSSAVPASRPVAATTAAPQASAAARQNPSTGHREAVTAVAFSPDGKRIVSAGFDGEVLVWDAASGEVLRSLSIGPGVVQGLEVSPDGRSAVAAIELPQVFANGNWQVREEAQGAIRHFDLETGEVKRRIAGPRGCRSAKLYADGRRVLGACDHFVGIWDLGTGVQSWKGDSGKDLGKAACAALSPAQDRVLAAFEGAAMELWPSNGAQTVRTLQGYTVQYGDVAFLPSGKQVVALAHDPYGEGPQLWDIEMGVKLHSFGGHTGEAWSVAVSPDGKLAATAEKDWNVRLWDIATGKRLRTLEGHRHWVSMVAFSPDGGRIASVSRDHTVRVWDAMTGALVWARGASDGQPVTDRDVPRVEPGTLSVPPPSWLEGWTDTPLAEPSTAVPTLAEWNASRVLGFAGSAAMGCEARLVREWMRVSCRGVSAAGAMPERVEVQGANGSTFVHAGKGVVSFVVPLPEGRAVTAWVTWSDARERLRLRRNAGVRGGFDTLPLLLQDDERVVRGQRLCTCENESRGERKACSVADALATQGVQSANPHCYRTYSSQCQAFVECNRGEPGRPPSCPGNTWMFLQECHLKCAQGSSSCPSGTTCSLLYDDRWGCN